MSLRLPKMVDIPLESSLPQYGSTDDVDDVRSHRMRLSKFEETEIIGSVAQLIANGESLYTKAPASASSTNGISSLTYEELAQHQLDSGALKDIFVVRKVGDKTQRVCVTDLTRKARVDK